MRLPKAVQEYLKKLAERKHETNVCPCCHHKGLNYSGEADIVDNNVLYKWVCPNCNATGHEGCSIRFEEHTVDSDGDSERLNIAKAKRALRARKNRRPRNAHA